MKWRISCIFFTRQGFWFTRHSSVSGLAHAQSCPALCDPMDCSLSDSSVHGILQARILEWVVMPTFNGSSQPRDRTQVSRIAGGFFTIWATREAQYWDTDAGLQARGWPLRRTRSSQFWMEWWSLCHLHSAAGGWGQHARVSLTLPSTGVIGKVVVWGRLSRRRGRACEVQSRGRAFAGTHLLGKPLQWAVPLFTPINGRREKAGFTSPPSGPQSGTGAWVLPAGLLPSSSPLHPGMMTMSPIPLWPERKGVCSD